MLTPAQFPACSERTSIDIPVSRSVARKPDFFGDIPLNALETLNVVRLSLLSLIVFCAQVPTRAPSRRLLDDAKQKK